MTSPDWQNPMNLAALAQRQSLATLLQALDPATALATGGTVEARLIALAGDGTATARIGNATIALVLAGPEAKQAALTPGALLLLKLVPAEQPGAPVRATLLEIRPAPQSTTPAPAPLPNPVAPQASVPAPTPSPLPPATVLNPASSSQSAPNPAGPPMATVAAPPNTASAPALAAVALQPGAAAPAPAVGQPISPQAVPAAAPTPRAAAGPLLGAALANQDGLAPLLANLRSLADGAISPVVPRPLLKLAEQILAQALPVEHRPLTPEALKQAVQRSGLFMEAQQAAGQPVPPQADLKAGLVALRDALAPMLTERGEQPAGKPLPEAAADPQNQAIRPAPPRRDGPLALQPIAEPTLSAGEKPLVVAEALLRQTDAALDRITLSQYASMPLDAARGETAPAQRWLTEIPLGFHAGTAMLPLQVEREPQKRGASGAEGPLWRVRFALDVEPMGPLQGVVTLQGRSVGVTLWAEREETSRLLRGAAPSLEAALVDAQFENGAIDIHTGQPRVMQATAGQFLDRLS